MNIWLIGASATLVAIGVADGGVLVRWFTRRRHLGGTALLLAVLLMLIGLVRAGTA